ncbi:MAG: hypothetical protein MZV65_28800 [Chromatiales bacterium]|nr:hypothetical protein [Chromatiales bacterium]
MDELAQACAVFDEELILRGLQELVPEFAQEDDVLSVTEEAETSGPAVMNPTSALVL